VKPYRPAGHRPARSKGHMLEGSHACLVVLILTGKNSHNGPLLTRIRALMSFFWALS